MSRRQDRLSQSEALETAAIAETPELARSQVDYAVEAITYQYDAAPLASIVNHIVQSSTFRQFFHTREQEPPPALEDAGFILGILTSFDALARQGSSQEAKVLLYDTALLGAVWSWGAVLGGLQEYRECAIAIKDAKEIGRLLGIAEAGILRRLDRPPVPVTFIEKLSTISGAQPITSVEALASIFSPAEIPLLVDLLIENTLVELFAGNTQTVSVLELIVQERYGAITNWGSHSRYAPTDLNEVLRIRDLAISSEAEGGQESITAYLLETTIFERLLTYQKIIARLIRKHEGTSSLSRLPRGAGFEAVAMAGVLDAFRIQILPPHPIAILVETGPLRRLLGHVRKQVANAVQGKPNLATVLQSETRLEDPGHLAEQVFAYALEEAFRGNLAPLEGKRRLLTADGNPYGWIHLGERRREVRTDAQTIFGVRDRTLAAISELPASRGQISKVIYKTALLRQFFAWQEALTAFNPHWSRTLLSQTSEPGRLERLLEVTLKQMEAALR